MTKTSETTLNFGAKPSIVFFGTGSVAAESLELLAQSFEIEAVVTKPKPKHHRGSFPTLDVAKKIGAPIIFVTNQVSVSEKIVAKSFRSRVAVLIDFGIIVSQDVIDAFPLGIINSHFSLLPELRGADPITFALLSGQKQTGVTLMHLTLAMDEGPVLGFGVHENIDKLTGPELTHNLIQLSYSLLRDLLPGYIAGDNEGHTPQEKLHDLITDFDYPSHASYTRKLSKTDSVLDFKKPAAQLEREIRAFIEWPKSRSSIAGKDVVITKAHCLPQSELQDTMLTIGKPFVYEKQLCIQTTKDILVVDTLKPAGKPEMTAAAFLAGHGKDL